MKEEVKVREEVDEEVYDLGEIEDEGSRPADDSGDGEDPRLEQLRKELADVRDQWVRAVADYDNFRKRSEREASDLRRYSLAEPFRELLIVLDNLERAVAAEGSVEDLKTGVRMTLQQFKDLMRRFGVSEVPSEGEPFNPTVHDAVSRFEDESVSVPTIADELQRGYRLHDRLLRPAMVRVAMPVPEAQGRGGAEDEGGS